MSQSSEIFTHHPFHYQTTTQQPPSLPLPPPRRAHSSPLQLTRYPTLFSACLSPHHAWRPRYHWQLPQPTTPLLQLHACCPLIYLHHLFTRPAPSTGHLMLSRCREACCELGPDQCHAFQWKVIPDIPPGNGFAGGGCFYGLSLRTPDTCWGPGTPNVCCAQMAFIIAARYF